MANSLKESPMSLWINTKVVIDIATDSILETVPYTYVGSIAELKGGSKSTTSSTMIMPAPTAAEQQQTGLQNFANTAALEAQGYHIGNQGEYEQTNGQGGWNYLSGAGAGAMYIRPKTDAEYSPEEQQ